MDYWNEVAKLEEDITRSETVGRGGELLQGEQSIDNAGAPVVEGNTGGAVSNSVQSNGENVATQENQQQVNVPVGNSEQLSSSEIPNNPTISQTSDQVAEGGNAPGKSGVDPRNMSYDERAKRGDMLRNAPAVDVNEGVITSTKELSARKAAEKWWDENVTEPAFYDTEIGEVEISRNSVESSLAHRYGQAKLDALTSLIEGFENAVYLGSMSDGTRHGGVMNHYFAYPINYKGERCYVFCRAMHDANKNRLYVHEVFIADRIKKGDTLQTAASQLHGGIALYKDILANVLDLEPTSVSEDRNSVSNSQENTQKSGETAENGGERMYSQEELAEAKEQLGELNATSAPEFAARLFSIKPWKTLEEANAALKELLASYGETLNGQSLAVMPFLDKAQGLIREYNKSQEPRSTEDEAPVTSEPTEQPEAGEVANAGPVNRETLQLNLSEEDFNALLNSGDKAAISEYLAEMDGLLRIGAGSPLDGQEALREEYRKAVEQYGKENIPAEVMDDLNSRMQPYSDLSRAIFDRKYALQDKLREIEANEAQAKEQAEKEAKAEHKKTAFGGFLASKSDVGASAAEKALNKKYNFDGKVMTVAEFVEEAVANGNAKLSTIEEPKYKGASRTAWNRMDAKQQEADAKRVKESGTKTVYTVNDHDLGKTAYDYAKFLLEKKAEQEKAAAKQKVKDAIEPFAKEKAAENNGEFSAENNDIHSREGDGPLTDREVVMESDVYSKVLGKPRYYGQKQRNYVARQRAKMAQKATELAEKLNTPIEVRETAEGLTGKKAKAKGWYDVKSGNIVVVVSNHGSIEDIQATVLHEVVAHKGLRQMFREHFDAFLDNVYNNVDAEIRAEIDALTEKYGNTREATEEYLASLAENTYFEKVNPSLWSRIKQWFLNMLTEVGIKLDFELSDNELRYILWRSHQRLVNPGIYNPVTRITDVAVRARLGIGEYAPAVEEMSHVAEEDAAEMQESVMEGQTMFRRGEKSSQKEENDKNWLSSLFEKAIEDDRRRKREEKNEREENLQNEPSGDVLYSRIYEEIISRSNRRAKGRNPIEVETQIQEANRQGGSIYAQTQTQKLQLEALRKLTNNEINTLRQEIESLLGEEWIKSDEYAESREKFEDFLYVIQRFQGRNERRYVVEKLTGEEVNKILWHENTHRAITKLFGEDLTKIEEVYNGLPDSEKSNVIKRLEEKNYDAEDFPAESMCYFVEEAYLNKFLNSKYKLSYIVEKVNPEMKDFANFVQGLIDYIDYGREGFESSGREGIERVGREGTKNAGELYIEQQLQERNGESDANGEGTDATEGATEPYSNGRENTRFRTTEEVIDRQEKNEADIARFDVSSLGERLNIPVRVAEAVPENRRNRKGWLDNAEKLMDILVDAHNKALGRVLEKAEKVKPKKVNAAGVEVIGSLDKFGQEMVGAYNAGKELSGKPLNDAVSEAYNNLAEADEKVRKVFDLDAEADVERFVNGYTPTGEEQKDAVIEEYKTERATVQGYELAREFVENIKSAKAEIADLEKELKKAYQEKREGVMSQEAYNEFRRSTINAIFESKIGMVDAYHSLISKFSEGVRDSGKSEAMNEYKRICRKSTEQRCKAIVKKTRA